MKTITIKQPWASLIVEGIKDIENRTWPTRFRGRVLIHAAGKIADFFKGENLAFTPEQWKMINSKIYTNKEKYKKDIFKYSAIIGSVEIVDCVLNHSSVWAEKPEPEYLTTEKGRELKVKPIYNWVLANPIKFHEPIPAKGKLSFWDYQNILAEPEEKDGELFCHCQLPVKEINQVTGDSQFGYYCRYCGGKWYK